MTLIVMLNTFMPRPYQTEGDMVYLFGYETLALTVDYLVLAPFDCFMVWFIWSKTKSDESRLTVWHLIICAYLVGNLYAHFSSCYMMYMGATASQVVAKYDVFMYGSFYACLALLLIGSLTDRVIRHGGYGIDLDLDVRAFVTGYLVAKRWG